MVSVEPGTRVCGGYVVMVLRGELDTADAESTGSAAAELAEGGRHLIIDMEILEYIDCHALSALLRARETAQRAGGDVLLVASRGPVLRLLTLAGVPSVTAAAAGSAGGGGGRYARELPVLSAPERCRVPDTG
jgi:anti-sigma B factor antagonist